MGSMDTFLIIYPYYKYRHKKQWGRQFPYLNVTGPTCDTSNLFYWPVFPNIYTKRYRAVQK